MTTNTTNDTLGFVDLRAHATPADPATPVGALPLGLWALRALLLALPPQRIAAAVDDASRPLAERAGVRALNNDEADALFLDRLDRGLAGPDLVATPAAPFCTAASARSALEATTPNLADFQSSPVERLRVTTPPEAEVASAVARGLAPDHPAIAGASRLRLPMRPVRAVIADVDGTLTDGTIVFPGHADPAAPEPEPARGFDTRDGMGINLLRKHRIPLGILSSTLRGESSRQRMRMMGVEHVDVAPGDKAERFLALCRAMATPPEHTLYVGVDINDAPAMDLAGTVACPADAHPAVRNRADLVLDAKGGRGALREIADLLIDARHLSALETSTGRG